MSTPKARIAVVNTHPIQYFAPLYAYLNAAPDLEVTALYLSDFSLRGAQDQGFKQVVKWDVDLLSGYPHVFVGPNAKKLEPRGFASMIVPTIWQAVRGGGYDALWLHGHGVAANLIALAAAKSIGIPVFMRCDTHLGLSLTKLKAALRKPLMSMFYRQCDYFLAIGTANKNFYMSMGVPEGKISLVPYAVDNARFMTDARLTDEERRATRQRYGISPDRPAILYVSKFLRRKHPDHLVLAAQRLAAEGLSFDLVLAGSGEMQAELEVLIARGGPPNVVMPGFINQQDMPGVLGACDVFVLPAADEPWGLIVNEAMCAGLPVVVSSEIGCTVDLVRPGENGFTFEARDIEGLTNALRPIVNNVELRRAMSRKSVEIIERWSYHNCRDGLREAVSRCCGVTSRTEVVS
jgi:glycosyltransferase involved in cell wall biosynthesis